MKPLKFHSVLIPKLWGGKAIAELKGIEDAPARVGESLEISVLPKQETYCATEGYKGLTLRDLINRYGAELVGSANYERYGTEFPLLIKFIDACQPLSVQVHPDDAMAQSLGMPYGKSEMWYVVSTRPDADLMAGFREDVNPAQYEAMLADGSLMDCANHYMTKPDDVFYIPAGTLHSIGAGNLIVEVQQSSGATYRVYDFDRKDELGRKRELHVELARQALNFHASADCYHHVPETSGEPVPVVQSPYFTTQVLRLGTLKGDGQETNSAPYTLPLEHIDSFVVMVCYEGGATLTDNEGNTVRVKAGESLLVPASTKNIAFEVSERFACLLAYI